MIKVVIVMILAWHTVQLLVQMRRTGYGASQYLEQQNVRKKSSCDRINYGSYGQKAVSRSMAGCKSPTPGILTYMEQMDMSICNEWRINQIEINY